MLLGIQLIVSDSHDVIFEFMAGFRMNPTVSGIYSHPQRPQSAPPLKDVVHADHVALVATTDVHALS